MEGKSSYGHYAALFSILVWGTTFVSTKVLLESFLPIEILFFRFVLGFIALILLCPHRLKGTTAKQELTFALAGLSGATLYYLCENIALTYTMATNVSVIVAAAPLFTALLNKLTKDGKEKTSKLFYLGFIIAMAGICLISFNGSRLSLNPAGDLLALFAAFMWAVYSIIIKKVGTFGYNTILTTRRIFAYGILFMIPFYIAMGGRFDFNRFASASNLLNMLFLGICASALCFVTWNYAMKTLGAIRTSVYVYLVPVVTIIFSFIFLHEQLSLMVICGTALTLAGLLLSQDIKFPAARKKASQLS